MKGLIEVQKFIEQAEIFYVATMNGDRPSCRPFGATLLFDGKLYFITKKTKEVWRQITANPAVCVVCCDVKKDYDWLRIDCELVNDSENLGAKQAFLDKFGDLADEGYTLDSPDFQIFYATNIKAIRHDYDGNQEEIEL